MSTVPRGPEACSEDAAADKGAEPETGSCAVSAIVFTRVAASPALAVPFMRTTIAVMLS